MFNSYDTDFESDNIEMECEYCGWIGYYYETIHADVDEGGCEKIMCPECHLSCVFAREEE